MPARPIRPARLGRCSSGRARNPAILHGRSFTIAPDENPYEARDQAESTICDSGEWRFSAALVANVAPWGELLVDGRASLGVAAGCITDRCWCSYPGHPQLGFPVFSRGGNRPLDFQGARRSWRSMCRSSCGGVQVAPRRPRPSAMRRRHLRAAGNREDAIAPPAREGRGRGSYSECAGRAARNSRRFRALRRDPLRRAHRSAIG